MEKDKKTELTQESQKKFHPVYLWAIFYVITIYMFPLVFLLQNAGEETEENISFWPLIIPVLMGLVNLIIVLLYQKRIGRIRLLNCAIIIKYSLIPFFIFGGMIIAIALLLMFTPVVIGIFLGPVIAVIFSVLGWLVVVGSAPFSVAYIALSYKEKVHNRPFSIIAGICQFLFTLDVLSLMVLVLKEKRCVKSTVFVIILLILAIVVSTIWLGVKIATS